jgi:hypothetical protein
VSEKFSEVRFGENVLFRFFIFYLIFSAPIWLFVTLAGVIMFRFPNSSRMKRTAPTEIYLRKYIDARRPPLPGRLRQLPIRGYSIDLTAFVKMYLLKIKFQTSFKGVHQRGRGLGDRNGTNLCSGEDHCGTACLVPKRPFEQGAKKTQPDGAIEPN